MNGRTRPVSFGWWNLHDFAHYDAARISARRRPKRRADYDVKRDRVLAGLRQVFGEVFPDLLAVCETTREAAQDLLAELPQGYQVACAPPYPRDDGFQVAVFYRSAAGLTAELPLIPAESEDLTEETRPMIPVHLNVPGHVVRFVACHWTSFDALSCEIARQRLADVLRRDIHDFLDPEVPTPGLARHVVILGDLNEEPMSEIFETRLIGCRDRASSQRRHWRDAEVRRIRLYNAAWRYLGEQVPHGRAGPPIVGCAGTFFSEDLGWRTFDHLLVSGELLGSIPPYLDEAETRIAFTPLMRDSNARPTPFEPGKSSGVSDHLPIVGRLIVPEVPK
jgi:endonuclease/exonuclease/phosphatase family metal-dependent hydrolase